MTDEYREGRDAWFMGIGRDANPYVNTGQEDSEEEWDEGWDSVENNLHTIGFIDFYKIP